MLKINLEHQNDGLHARLDGKLTERETYHFYEYVIPYMKQKGIHYLYCDCRKLKKIDLDGKRALLETKLILKKEKGSLVLFNVKDTLRKELNGYRMRILS